MTKSLVWVPATRTLILNTNENSDRASDLAVTGKYTI